MPANLTPQYKEAESRFRSAGTHEDKLAALREMLALLPKHKGTEKLHGDLRKRLAKLEEEGAHANRAGARRDDPGHVHREGAGQWVLIGPPNAGKSALLAALTHAQPEVAPYPFTTRVPLPGMMPFENVQVQLVDTPPVTAEHCEAWMTNLVRHADGIVVVIDPADDDLEGRLAAIRRLFERARVQPAGTASAADAVPLAVVRPVLVALNKCDEDPDGTFAAVARESLDPAWAPTTVSAAHGHGLEALRGLLFTSLDRIRVYAKLPGHAPDRERPFVLARGATVLDFAQLVHKEIAERMKFARIWGHASFEGQQVDRQHELADGDVVELHA